MSINSSGLDNASTLANFSALYEKLKILLAVLEENLGFEYAFDLGYVNANPMHLGLSGKFYAEVNAPKLISDAEFFSNFKNVFNLKTLNKSCNVGSIEQIGSESFKFELNSIINQSEKDFISEVYNKLYNLNFLINHRRSNESSWEMVKLNFEMLKKDNKHSALLSEHFHLERSYNKIYAYFKYLNYPNSNNLNSLILRILNKEINTQDFSLFKLFFEELFNKFSGLNSHNLSKFKSLKCPDSDKTSVKNSKDYFPFAYPFSKEDYRINKYFAFDDSTSKLFSKLSAQNANNSIVIDAITGLNIKFYRNFQNYNFPSLLTQEQKSEIKSKIDDSLILCAFNEKNIHENLKQISEEVFIHSNTSDHIIFELASKLPRKKLQEKVEDFVKQFLLFCSNSEIKKNYFAWVNNTGYLTRDISLLGLGLSYSLQLDLETLDSEVLDKELSYFKAKNPFCSIVINKDEDNQILLIENNKCFNNFFNYETIQGLLEKTSELLINLKIVPKPVKEESKEPEASGIENNINNYINPNIIASPGEAEKLFHSGIFASGSNNENNISIEGSSIHLNDSKVSDKGDEKSKTNLEQFSGNLNIDEDKKPASTEDDILICDD